MAVPLSVLNQFIALVNQTPVVDSIPPDLSPTQTQDIEISIAVDQDSPNPELFLSQDPVDFGKAQLHAAYQSSALMPTNLVNSLLSRIEEREPTVQGWVVIAPDAHQMASKCDQQFPSSEPHKPLLGVPIGVKDLVDVFGLPTRCGSRQTSSDPAMIDATAISRLRDAGAIILGKTNTHEYAFGGTTPPTRNPWDPERIPASYCGAVGFMGSYGAVPTDHVAVLAWSLDHVGVMARSVADTALMYEVVAGIPSTTAPAAIGLPSTIGIPRAAHEPMHPAIRTAFDGAVAALVARGVKVVDVSRGQIQISWRQLASFS